MPDFKRMSTNATSTIQQYTYFKFLVKGMEYSPPPFFSTSRKKKKQKEKKCQHLGQKANKRKNKTFWLYEKKLIYLFEGNYNDFLNIFFN